MISWPDLSDLARRARDLEDLRRAGVLNHDQFSELAEVLQREALRQTVPEILFHCACGKEAATFPLRGTVAVDELIKNLHPASKGVDVAAVHSWVQNVRDCRHVGRIGVFCCAAGNLVLVSTDTNPHEDE